MIQNVVPQLTFSFYRECPIQTDFSGGQLTTDGGLLPLRAFDERYGLSQSIAQLLIESRELGHIQHAIPALLAQRLYGIIAGYEDGNDAQRLRLDPVFQMLANYPLQEPLGSQPTLSRWENAVTAKEVMQLNHLLLDWFVKLCGRQVRQRGEILLDVDSTDDPTHGQQQLSLFNGHFRETCYHPLLLFETHSGCLLSARLRRGNCVSYNRVVPMVRRVLKRLRGAFPKVRIRLRADAGFAIPGLYELLEEYGVSYAIRFPTHQFVKKQVEPLRQLVEKAHRDTGREYRVYTTFHHYSPAWECARRLCVEIHYPDERLPVRAIINNQEDSAHQVTRFYNGRGEGENRIEELKNGFYADRLSCHRFVANAFRLMLHSLAYSLVNLFRQRHLPVSLRSLQIETLRVQIFKMAAQVYRTARCIRVRFATGWPFADLFHRVARSFSSA